MVDLQWVTLLMDEYLVNKTLIAVYTRHVLDSLALAKSDRGDIFKAPFFFFYGVTFFCRGKPAGLSYIRGMSLNSATDGAYQPMDELANPLTHGGRVSAVKGPISTGIQWLAKNWILRFVDVQ